jgi:hypothetical protein
MAELNTALQFSVHCGHSQRLIRARRLFIESYLRRHEFAQVQSEADGDESLVFSMTAEGRRFCLWVSDAWLLSNTHARVEERLDRLQVRRMLPEHGRAYLDVDETGQEFLSPF